jgi:TolA-binding protein
MYGLNFTVKAGIFYWAHNTHREGTNTYPKNTIRINSHSLLGSLLINQSQGTAAMQGYEELVDGLLYPLVLI